MRTDRPDKLKTPEYSLYCTECHQDIQDTGSSSQGNVHDHLCQCLDDIPITIISMHCLTITATLAAYLGYTLRMKTLFRG